MTASEISVLRRRARRRQKPYWRRTAWENVGQSSKKVERGKRWRSAGVSAAGAGGSAAAVVIGSELSMFSERAQLAGFSRDEPGELRSPAKWRFGYHQFMQFEISVTRSFSAAHQLRLCDGSLEPLHGHNWQVRVTVSAEKLDSIGVVMDFHELERLVDEIVRPMHNANLNDLPAFESINPSAENVAADIARALVLPAGSPARLRCVEVWETPDCRATVRL